MIYISIDMLSCGNADSIIIWLKDHIGNNYVVLIDGGNKSDSEKIISHLDNYILGSQASGKIAPDLIISTHHDKDHIGGLIQIVNHYGVAIGEVWVNNPAEHIGTLKYGLLKESFRRKSDLKQYQVIAESLSNLDDFISTVDRHGINRRDALQGRNKFDGVIRVLGPSKPFYESLLPGMDGLTNFVNEEATWAYHSIFGNGIVNELIESTRPCSIVDKENQTSATNNSSTIIEMLVGNNDRYLFTGDAGVSAFEDVEATESLANIYWLDVPHHGSRRNLTSRLIQKMSPTVCFISAEGSAKHPRQALVNCLKLHGANVFCTKGGVDLWHHFGNFPSRNTYSAADSL